MGTRVTVGPDVKLGSHDIKLFSETEAWGLRLEGGAAGLKEIPATPQTSLFAKTGQKHGDFEYGFTHLEQRTWEGGRGLLDASEDQTRFFDSKHLWSVTPGKIAPAPKINYLSTPAGGESALPLEEDAIAAARWESLYTTASFSKQAFKYTAGATYTAKAITLWFRLYSGLAATGAEDIAVAIYDDSSGPNASQVAGTFSKEDFTGSMGPVTAVFDTPMAFTSAGVYWIVITCPSSAVVTQLACYAGTAVHYEYSDAWYAHANQHVPYYRFHNELPRKWHYFEFDGALYAIDKQDDGTVSQLYMNGERGVCDDTGGTTVTSTTLVDVDEGIDTSWAADQWNGYWIKITNGTGKGQARLITATTDAGVITISPAWDITPADNDSEYVIYGGPVWQELAPGLAASEQCSGVAVFNDQVAFAIGDAKIVRLMGFNEAADPPAHKFADDATSYHAEYLHSFQDPVDGAVVWRAEAGQVSKAPAQSYGSNLTFGTAIDVGDTQHPITNLLDYDGKLFVMKTDSVWYVSGGDDPKAIKLPIGLESMPNSTNGVAAAATNLHLYFNWAFSVERYYGGLVDDIGPWHGEGIPADRQGYVSAIVPAFGWLFVAVDAGRSNTDNYSSVYLYNQSGYHEIFRGWAGGRVRSLHFQGNEDTNPCLWIGIDGEMVYVKFPKYTLDPLQESGFECEGSAELISPTIDLGVAGLPKYIKEIEIHSENLNANTFILVDAQWDEDVGSTTWYSMDAVYNSPRDKVSVNVGNIYKLRYRLRFVTQDADNIPIVEAVVVKGFARTPVKYQWHITAKTSDVQLTLRGTVDHSPNDLYEALIDYAESAKPVYVKSKWPRLNDIVCVVEPLSIFRNYTTTIPQQQEGAVIQFTLRAA